MMTGSLKWLVLATVLSFFAIIIMVYGLYRNNSISNKPADLPEEADANRQQGQKIFYKHAAVAGILLAVAAVIFFISKGAGA